MDDDVVLQKVVIGRSIDGALIDCALETMGELEFILLPGANMVLLAAAIR
jgi:hypothetical protein